MILINPAEEREVYQCFKRWYEQELDGIKEDTDPLEAHTQGIAQAIRAVFQLGLSMGYTAGAEYAQKEKNGDGGNSSN